MPASRIAPKSPIALGALCDIERHRFPVAISDISPDGCACEAELDWAGPGDFLHLRIADSVDINGRVLSRHGHTARIGFFGQIHPAVIAGWKRAALV